MNKNLFKFGWIIKILSKDEDGFQVELADLGNEKHMIVLTDLLHKVSKDVYRQAGYGPFVLDKDAGFEEQINILKEDLKSKRANNG